MRTHPEIGGDTLRERHRALRTATASSAWVWKSLTTTTSIGTAQDIRAAWQDAHIPLAARIVALADAYDTITSRRPYKIASITRRRSAGSRGTAAAHFDPVLVDVFLHCHRDFAEIRGRLTDPVTPAGGADARPLRRRTGRG